MSAVPTFAERVAIHMAPSWYSAAHPEGGEQPTAYAAERWADHVAEVQRTIRSAAVIGTGVLHEDTLTAITGTTEGDLLIALAHHHDRPDVAELLEDWLTQLRAREADGRPLRENPTGVLAVVVDLVERAAARPGGPGRRTS